MEHQEEASQAGVEAKHNYSFGTKRMMDNSYQRVIVVSIHNYSFGIK